ncbi:MAG: hypothetical protein ACK52I_02125 [Pseudomonadota bacterium]
MTKTQRAAMQQALEALRDMYAGWQYIRSFHGDLYGVGWDRCDEKGKPAPPSKLLRPPWRSRPSRSRSRSQWRTR